MTTAPPQLPPPNHRERQPLEKCVTHLLEECRMVLPGIQAILGFQLIAVFNNGFSQKLSPHEQIAHLVSVGLMILAVGCLLAPAAYHRIAETHSISETFVSFASRLLTLGLFFLMIALCLDLYLIARVITHSIPIAATVAAFATLILATLWFFFPFARRKRTHYH